MLPKSPTSTPFSGAQGQPVALSEDGPNPQKEATVLLCKRVFRFPRTKPRFSPERERVAAVLTALVPCPAGREEPGPGKSKPHLELPEDAPRVPVVVVSQGDVLQALSVCLQVVLHVLEEPGLVVIANAIQLK